MGGLIMSELISPPPPDSWRFYSSSDFSHSFENFYTSFWFPYIQICYDSVALCDGLSEGGVYLLVTQLLHDCLKDQTLKVVVIELFFQIFLTLRLKIGALTSG